MLDKKGLFKSLGRRLKQLREAANESLAEASGAVEIDVKELAGYELGQSRPSEDVLMLLLSHFGVNDNDAVQLWELAGYHVNKGHETQSATDNSKSQIIFTDVVDVLVNNYGVVMNFMQTSGPNAAPTQVARVGMSREHAKSVLQILQATLAQTEKNLPRHIISPDSINPDKLA